VKKKGPDCNRNDRDKRRNEIEEKKVRLVGKKKREI